jgi:hypothetical protein
MRLWSFHPRYLDAKGLVALWRESLLARAVLQGKTKGYTRHPQLERFRGAGDPVEAIDRYLRVVHEEATDRGYSFDASKLCAMSHDAGPLDGKPTVTGGQLAYEWGHYLRKLERRDPGHMREMRRVKVPDPHPLFAVVGGEAESWERPKG